LTNHVLEVPMPQENTRVIRFLQQENARLKKENRVLYDEVYALRRYIKTLHRVQESVQHFTPEKEVLALLDETLDSALELLDATDASLLLIDEETEELVFVLVHGSVNETLPGYRIDRDQGIAGWVTENVELAIVNDVHSDWRFSSTVDESSDFTTHSVIAAPLTARDEVLGVIEVLNKRSGEDFNNDDANALSILATLAAFALESVTSAPEEANEQP